jgi:hypothetical protein
MSEKVNPKNPGLVVDIVRGKNEDLPEGLEPVGGGASTRIFSEAFSSDTLPEGLEESRPGMLTRMGEAALGAGQGLIKESPTVAGAVSGLKLGLPFGPIPAVGGMLVGGFGGYYVGQTAEEGYKALFPEPVDPTSKAYREGGKTFGGTLPFIAATPYLPTLTSNRVGRFITGIRDAAVRNPKTFKISETIAATGAGVGGGIAESYDPGAPGTRFMGEVAGGLFAPGRFVINASATVADGLSKMAGSFSAGSREARAANRLYTILQESGEDIPTLIRRLEADMPIDQLSLPGAKRITPTSAQKTGSLALTEMETALGSASREFLGESREQGRQASMAYQMLVDRLKNIGTQDALAMAAKLQEQRFTSMLDGRLAAADANAALKISRITRDTPEARQQIGAIVKNETETALRSARDYESQLWTNALDSLTASSITKQEGRAAGNNLGIRVAFTLTPSNTANSFLNRAVSVGPALYEDAIPLPVRNVMKAMGIDKESVQKFRAGQMTQEFIDTRQVPARFMPNVKALGADELVNYRSTLLKMSREAAGKGDMNNANFYGSIADGMLQDLNSLKNPEFDEARTFSKSLNDVFTRTFAKTASETGDVAGSGAERLPAEILVARAFGGNPDVTAMRMNELEDAVKFMSTRYDDAVRRFGVDSPQAKALKPSADVSRAGAASMADAQQRVLRMGAAAAIDTTFDPATGREVTRLNTKKLQKFVAENKPMLDKLGITGDLTDATKAENAFRMVQNENSALMKRAADQYAFGQVLKIGGERPSLAVGSMLNGNTPVRDMRNLVTMVKSSNSPEAAIRGLKSSLYDYAYTKATSAGGKFSPQAFEDAFFKPLGPNQPSIVNVMRANGIMTFGEMKNIKRLVDPMIRIEKAVASGRTMDEVVPGADAITDFAIGNLGLRAASTVAPAGPGSLQAAAAGSSLFRNVLGKMPNMSIVTLLERAAQDPDFAALLLRKGKTEREKLNIARQLHGYLFSAGLNYATYEEPQPEPVASSQPPFTVQGQAARQLRQLPVAPSTRGFPGMNANAATTKPAAPSSGPPTQGNARAQFQALFPFDSVSPMLNNSNTPAR